MNIVICEDEPYWNEALKTAVSKWAAIKKINPDYKSFSTPQMLLDYLKDQNNDIDVIFLDISLGEKVINGMALAKLIRKKGNTMPIIFVTANSYRAADGYLVDALGYLTKPIDENRLHLFLNRIIKQKRSQKRIKIMSEGRLSNIYQQDIVYVEISDHIMGIHTPQGVSTQRGTLGEALALLGEENFIQIHRSYIIALDKIDWIKNTAPYSVTLIKKNERIELPVSRKYIKKLIEVYSDDLLERMI